MAEMQGKAMAIPAGGRILWSAEAKGKSADRSSPGRLSWYFAQRSMPGLVYAATMNGYVASDLCKMEGGRESD